MNLDSLMSRPTVRGYEARHGIEAFGALLCKALALPPVTIEWGPVPTACINQQGEITLSDLGDSAQVGRRTLARFAGFLLHELLHRKWTDFGAQDHRPYVRALHNGIEDAWIERRCIDAGLTGNARGLLRSVIRGMIDEAPQGIDWANPAQYPFSLAVFLRQYGATVPVPASLLPTYQEALRRLPACQNSHDTLALAQWVYAQMRGEEQQGKLDQGNDKPDQGDDQGEDDQQAQDDQGKPDRGQDGQSGDGQEQGQEQGQDGPGSAQSEGEEEDTPADAGEAQKPGARTKTMETEPECPASQGGTGGTYTGQTDMGTAPMHDTPRNMAAQVPGRLRYEVRRLFENSAADWREAGYRSGRLNSGALARVGVGATNVFSRRFEQDGIDSAAVLVLDLSSSMEERFTDKQSRTYPLDLAAQATWALCESLLAAQVDVAVLGFDHRLFVLRPFGSTPGAKTRDTLSRVGSYGSTNDYAAIRHAHDLLLRHPAQRRVAFVLTDGMGSPGATSAQVKQGQALGIRTIAVGIGHDVAWVYGPESVRVDKLSDLGTVAFGRMKVAA